MNINEPISNPKLVNAIEGLSNNNATQQKFFEEFAQAKLLCPADIQLQNSTRDGNEIVVGGRVFNICKAYRRHRRQ